MSMSITVFVSVTCLNQKIDTKSICIIWLFKSDLYYLKVAVEPAVEEK